MPSSPFVEMTTLFDAEVVVTGTTTGSIKSLLASKSGQYIVSMFVPVEVATGTSTGKVRIEVSTDKAFTAGSIARVFQFQDIDQGLGTAPYSLWGKIDLLQTQAELVGPGAPGEGIDVGLIAPFVRAVCVGADGDGDFSATITVNIIPV